MKKLKTLTTPDGNTYMVADKTTLDGNVLKFWKSLEPPETEDTLLYSVDLSSLNVSVELDNTLSESGKAADSKVVGDMLSQLSNKNASDIAELKNNSVTMYEDSNGDIVMEFGGVSI